MSTQPRKDERVSPLAVVRWRDIGGAPVSSYPLPRPLADAVARAFAATYPRETFWVEDVPWLATVTPLERGLEHRRAGTPVWRAAAGNTTPSVTP